MTTNAGYEYGLAEMEYAKARTSQEKLAALRKMLTTAPKHKSAEKLNLALKKRYSDLKKDIEKEKKAGRGKSFAIKKEGACQVVFVGLPNSGKSWLLSKLSKEFVEVADYPFTTKVPEVRMIPFENVWFQGIEIPALYSGFSENPMSGQLLGLIRNADLIVFVIDGEDKPKDACNILLGELKKANILVGKNKSQNINLQEVPGIIVYTKTDAKLDTKIPQYYCEDEDRLLLGIWYASHKIRCQTRTRGKTAEKPVLLDEGATIKNLAETVHKDFVKRFKHAKVWGPSAAFAGQQVGLEHRLKDKDIVEIFID